MNKKINGNKEVKKSLVSGLDFTALLIEAVQKPGKLLEAFEAFYDFSFYNMMVAMRQCEVRGIELGPIATFKRWKAKGRHVKRGEKAISLFMPIVRTGKKENEGGTEEQETISGFMCIPRWFVLSQTDGKPYKEPKAKVGNFSFEKALTKLKIKKVKFEHINGNVQGYACKRKVAVNPLAALPEKTLLHEVAHVMLGHTGGSDTFSDAEKLEKSLKEIEAESVALLCLSTLGLAEAEYSRGYIQHWMKAGNKNKIPEASAKKIISVVDKILKAGR